MLKNVLTALSLSLFSTGFVTTSAAGERGSFVLQNPTGVTIHYQLSRGNERKWKSWRLLPRQQRALYFPLDKNGQAFVPYIRFDAVGGDDRFTGKTYELDFSNITNPWDGIEYYFKYDWTGRNLELYERN